MKYKSILFPFFYQRISRPNAIREIDDINM